MGLVIPTLIGWEYDSATFFAGSGFGSKGELTTTTSVNFNTPPNHTVSFTWAASEPEEGVQSETPSTKQHFINEDEELKVEVVTSGTAKFEAGGKAPHLVIELVPASVEPTATGLVMLL